MIAYNNEWLYNRIVRAQANEACVEGGISANSCERIYIAYPVGFYQVGAWASFGFALVTWLILSAVLGLLALMFGISEYASGLIIFMGLSCWGAAEWIVKSKHHYNSGIDNMLTWWAAGLLCGGIYQILSWRGDNSSETIAALFTFIICTGFVLRFTDRLLSYVGSISLMFFVYFLWIQIGPAAGAPYLMIIASACIYYFTMKASNSHTLLYYRSNLRCVRTMGLASLYFSGNYFVAHELMHMGLLHVLYGSPMTQSDYMGWFFWLWTMGLPVVYVIWGLRAKSLVHLRSGVILFSISILTFRYYHSIISADKALTLAGVILIIVSYILINRLGTPKGGFTFQQIKKMAISVKEPQIQETSLEDIDP